MALYDVYRDVSTTYCQFSSGDEVDWSYMILKYNTLLCLVVFQQLWLVNFDPCCLTQRFPPSAVRCRIALLLLCFLIGGIQAPGISIPLSLLMLSGWSLIWIASLTLKGTWRVLLRKSESDRDQVRITTCHACSFTIFVSCKVMQFPRNWTWAILRIEIGKKSGSYWKWVIAQV